MSNSTINALPDAFYDQFLSDSVKARKPSPIHSLVPLEDTPGILSLLAGKPNPSGFPITSLTFTAKSPSANEDETMITLSPSDLSIALQYGSTQGYTKFINWLVGLQEIDHGIQRDEGNWGLAIGAGSSDLIYKAVASVINPGDVMLTESPVYAGVLPVFDHYQCQKIEIESDSSGISPEALRTTLENWPAHTPRPKYLYTVPNGSNPSGMSTTTERRKEILALAREFNFLIFEDDPYYNLIFSDEPRSPSYLSLEKTESHPEGVGRVLRFDSLSKVMSSGMRMGFVTGHKVLIDAINGHTAVQSLQTSTFTQILAYTILNAWGYDGFHKHCGGVAQLYRQKRDSFEKSLEKHLNGLAVWVRPEAGMFFWFKLLLHPDAEDDTHQHEGDSEFVIRTTAFQHGVLVLPGTVFFANALDERGERRKSAYVRAAFSFMGDEDANEALKRLRSAVLEAREKFKE